MIIQVTAEDIKQGKADSCTLCPIALALRRQLNLALGVIVFGFCIYIGRKYLYLPLTVKEFITNYDNPNLKHLAVPFEFELDLSAAPSN